MQELISFIFQEMKEANTAFTYVNTLILVLMLLKKW